MYIKEIVFNAIDKAKKKLIESRETSPKNNYKVLNEAKTREYGHLIKQSSSNQNEKEWWIICQNWQQKRKSLSTTQHEAIHEYIRH